MNRSLFFSKKRLLTKTQERGTEMWKGIRNLWSVLFSFSSACYKFQKNDCSIQTLSKCSLSKTVQRSIASSFLVSKHGARNGKRIAIAELTSAKFFRIRKMDTQQLLHPARRGTFLDSFLVLFFRPSYIRFRSLARDERSVLLVYKETRLAICLFLESNREKWLCNLCEWRRARWRTGVWNKWIQEVAYGIMQENLRLKAPEMYE